MVRIYEFLETANRDCADIKLIEIVEHLQTLKGSLLTKRFQGSDEVDGEEGAKASRTIDLSVAI